MDKKLTLTYCIILLIGVIFSIFVTLTFHNEIYSKYEDNSVVELNVKSNDMIKQEKTKTENIYRIILPKNNISDKVIAFDTVHVNAEVHIDDELIYSIKPDRKSMMKTTGYNWNFVVLSDDYDGKELIIDIRTPYNSKIPNSTIYFGRQSAITNKIIKDDLYTALISLSIFIIGIIMLIYSVVITNHRRFDRSLMHFSIFTTLIGIWLFSNSDICKLIVPMSLLNVFLVHISLMLMMIPFLMFFIDYYDDNSNNVNRQRVLNIYIFIVCGIAVVRLFLQFIGLYDFKETLWITHLSIIVFIIAGLYFIIRNYSKRTVTKKMRINMIAIAVILFSVMADLITYNLTQKNSSFGPIGFLIYTAIMGINIIQKNHKMIEQAQESEAYKKLAYTDELTGLYNRTAYTKDLDSLQQFDESSGKIISQPTAIFMFDLNDLKKCNDNFGHEYGDQYIKMASDTIMAVFGSDGKCYRIGGDEFCVLMPFTSNKDVIGKFDMFRKKIQEIQKNPFVVPIYVACGYAVYDESTDKTLDETRKRADNMMYKNKENSKMKKSGLGN